MSFRRGIVLLALAICPLGANADDYKINQLEQDVRELRRQVQVLTRQIETPRLQTAPGATASAVSPSPAAPAATIPAWVDAAKWQRLSPGMSELEAVSILGPPTSMRTQDGQRVLLYALEIGASGFLGGRVTLRERVVVEVQKPVLQ